MMLLKTKSYYGFSVVEVMLAVGLFMIFASGMVTVVLRGMDNNRVSGEQEIANQFASEGLEMARSIRNQNYLGLVNGTTNSSYDKYSRTVVVSDVQRDGGGNIVASGGTVDPNTKRMVSTVSWNVNTARANSVVLTTYLTDWRTGGAITSCNDYAVAQGYLSGVCRQNAVQCTSNGEIHLPMGDADCLDFPPADSCCAVPTPTPTPTITPTPTPPPASCLDICVTFGYTTSTCRRNAGACSSNKETNIPSGDIFCTGGPNADTCCCK